MELRQLRDFLALAEELHYARAAARFGIAQAPLSRRIKEFEQGLGVLLFARTSRGTQLTPRGEILVPWARSLLKAADQVKTLVATSSPTYAAVRVAICEDVPSRTLLPVLAHFQRSQPGISILHVEPPCAQQANELQAQLVDVGLGLFPHRALELSVESLWTHSAYAVLPSGHPLSRETEIERQHVKDLRIGLLDKEATDLPLRARLEALAHHISDKIQTLQMHRVSKS